MRTLIYVPIIHTSADLGSIAEDVTKRGIVGFGEEFWEQHNKTIAGFWNSVAKYFANLDVQMFKIYQDALVADGEVGQKIVEEAVKSGSKNYEIIDDLIKRGAHLARTEDFPLVKKERDCIVKISQAKTIFRKLAAYFVYRIIKNGLLRKRDDYIIREINETLNHNETCILFMGAYHNIIPGLSKKMRIIEIKQVNKLRDYQRLLLCHNRNKEKFRKLSEYLIAPVRACHPCGSRDL